MALKRPTIPTVTGVVNAPAFMAARGAIQRITGEVGGKTALPEIRKLTFSATPTKAELEAFNDYVNAWAEAVQKFITRVEG